ncbi:MAG: translation initiation factor [Planctomycetaceae bacterium]|nr:translation initiation factor [Planctomycetaceae bacterium]
MGLLAGTPWDRPPVCEHCGKLESECPCPPVLAPSSLIPPNKQTAKLAVEKRKKGKVVTVVRGLAAEANDLPALLARLKNSCGAGGTLDGDSLEVQGDHLERLRTLLDELGYKVRG